MANILTKRLRTLGNFFFGTWMPFLYLDAGDKRKHTYDINALHMSSAVMICVEWIIKNVPTSDIAVETHKEGWEINKEHDLAVLLGTPSRWYTASQFWRATIQDYLLNGNAYWVKLRNPMNEVVELAYVNANLICPEPSMNEYALVEEYRYSPASGQQVIYKADDIVHFRFGINRKSPQEGESIFKPLLREIFMDEECAEYAAAILANTGRPAMIIYPTSDVNPLTRDQRDEIQTTIENKFSGEQRGGVIVSSEPIGIEYIGWSPSEMDLRALRNIPEERIAAICGIPSEVVGFGSGVRQTTSGTTIEEQERQAWRECIVPMQKAIAEELTRSLLPEFEVNLTNKRCCFDNQGSLVLLKDKRVEAERMRLLLDGQMITRAEARAYLGLPVMEEDDMYIEKPTRERGADIAEQYDDDQGTSDGIQGHTGN